MNKTLSEQLGNLRDNINTHKEPENASYLSPVSSANQQFSTLFSETNYLTQVPSNVKAIDLDWGRSRDTEVTNLFGKAEATLDERRREASSDRHLKSALSVCLLGLGTASLYVLVKSCTNSDKGKKFSL
jgi:hypothetical protein